MIFGLLNEVFRVSTNARHVAFFIRMDDRYMIDWKDFGMRCQAAVTIKLVWKQQRWTVAHFIMETACTLDHPHAHDQKIAGRWHTSSWRPRALWTILMPTTQKIVLAATYVVLLLWWSLLWGAGIGVKLFFGEPVSA